MKEDKLEELIEKQEQLTADYEALLKSYDSKDLIRKNEELRSELRNYERELEDLKEHLYKLRDSNKELRLALEKQIIDERMKLLKISRQKLELYFSARANDYKDRLTALEDEVKNRLAKLGKKVEASLSNDQEDLMTDLEQLKTKIDKRIQYRKEQFEEERVEIKEYYEEGREDLANRKVTDKDLKKRKEENDLTEKKGLDYLKKFSILAIIISVFTIGRYIYLNWGNQYFKMAFIYLSGFISVGVGEVIPYQKQTAQERLSRLILIFGFSMLYFASLTQGPNTLVAASLVTLCALYLTKRHYSQSLFITVLIGAYSPLFFQLFNAVQYNAELSRIDIRISIFYVLINFILLSWVDIYILSHYHSFFQQINEVLLGVNSLFSFITLFWLLSNSILRNNLFLVPLFFIIFYVTLTKQIDLDKYKNLAWKLVFKRLNILFIFLIPVVQFEIEWWPLAWLIEGALLIAYLIFGQERKIIRFSHTAQLIDYFKYFALLSSWGYLIYFALTFSNYSFFFIAIINFSLAYLLQNVEFLTDQIMDYISLIFYLMADSLVIYLTLSQRINLTNTAVNIYLLGSLLLLVNLLLLINLRQLIITFLERYKYNLEFYPLSFGGLSAVYLTTIAIFRFNLNFASLTLTVLYLILALGYILYGFYRNFIYARLTGLFILILVAIKFFAYDLSFLTGIIRLSTYLGLGISLLIIYSFYQNLKDNA